MSHPTSVAIRDAGDDVVAHLEWCERCRAAIEVDVDLVAVRRRIVAEIAGTAAPGQGSPALGRPRRPWMVAAAAAVALLALFAPLALRQVNVGRPDLAQSEAEAMERMFASEQEELLPLADGEDWSVSIARRGPGFCTHITTFDGSTTSDACTVEAGMNIPAVLWFNIGVADAAVEWEWVDGAITGVVAADIDRIAVRFDSGVVDEVSPGDIVELGYRGFGLVFDATKVGLPVELEALRGTESQGAATADWLYPDFFRAVREEPRPLVDHDGWSVSIARRGNGYCAVAGGSGGGAERCFMEPGLGGDRLPVEVAMETFEPEGGEGGYGEGLVFGVVPEDVDRVTVRFDSSPDRDAHLGDTVEFGYRGFGVAFDGAEMGPPVEVLAFTGAEVRGRETLGISRRVGQEYQRESTD